MTANSGKFNILAQVIANIQMIRDAVKDRAVRAYDSKDIRSFEYWTGRFDATTEALDHLMALQELIRKDVTE